jgi:hypothetical protein
VFDFNLNASHRKKSLNKLIPRQEKLFEMQADNFRDETSEIGNINYIAKMFLFSLLSESDPAAN